MRVIWSKTEIMFIYSVPSVWQKHVRLAKRGFGRPHTDQCACAEAAEGEKKNEKRGREAKKKTRTPNEIVIRAALCHNNTGRRQRSEMDWMRCADRSTQIRRNERDAL